MTQRITPGTGICLVPEHNPLMLAKQVATPDRFSGGHFRFGIGAGWLQAETAIMGGDFDHRSGQTRKTPRKVMLYARAVALINEPPS